MMRKGPLERYPVDDVLRTAAAERLSGSIEVVAEVSGFLFLENGGLYLGTVDGTVPPPGVLPSGAEAPDGVRAHLVTVVTALMAQREGWYHHHQVHHPLGRHPMWNRRSISVEEVLREAGAALEQRAGLRPWSTGVLEVASTDEATCLEPDQWAVLGAMAHPATVYGLADRLGWPTDRVAAALDDLSHRRLLGVRDARPAAPEAPSEVSPGRWDGPADLRPRRLPAPSSSAPAGGGPTRGTLAVVGAPRAGQGPVEQGAAADDDGRRFALRRLISSLRQ